MKRLINLMLSAVLAGSTMFSAVTFVRAEEPVDLNDGLKNYWNFENVEAGATSVPSNDGKGVEAELIGNSVSIVDSEGTFGNVLHFGRENGSYMKVSDYINTSGNTSFSSCVLWLKRKNLRLESSTVSYKIVKLVKG